MNQNERSIHEGSAVSAAFLWPAALLVRLFFIFSALLIICWILYLTAMHLHWGPESAHQQTQAILATDLAFVSSLDHGAISSRIAVTSANGLYWGIWEITRIHEMMETFSNPAPRGMLDTFLRNMIVVPFQAEIYVLMDATKIMGLRLAVFVTTLPLFLLVYAIGMSDGLVQRYIRRAGAGRESSSLYHRAKFIQLGGSAFLVFTYICSPIEVDPRWIMLPAAGIMGLLARVQWTYFKKYL